MRALENVIRTETTAVPVDELIEHTDPEALPVAPRFAEPKFSGSVKVPAGISSCHDTLSARQVQCLGGDAPGRFQTLEPTHWPAAIPPA